MDNSIRSIPRWILSLTSRERIRFNYWRQRFTDREARWATQQQVPISGQTAKWLSAAREEEIIFFMRLDKVDRLKAIQNAGKSLRLRNIMDGFDPYNIFRMNS